MYARLLFVVVDIFAPVLAGFPRLSVPVPELRLGTMGGGGYTLAP
jgi:hypothetical protein